MRPLTILSMSLPLPAYCVSSVRRREISRSLMARMLLMSRLAFMTGLLEMARARSANLHSKARKVGKEGQGPQPGAGGRLARFRGSLVGLSVLSQDVWRLFD